MQHRTNFYRECTGENGSVRRPNLEEPSRYHTDKQLTNYEYYKYRHRDSYSEYACQKYLTRHTEIC